MQSIVDSLIITLGLDPKGVETGMAKAENRISGGVKNITKNILASLAGAFAFQQLFSSYLAEADELGDLSDAISVSVEDLDAWGQAAQYAGGSVQGFQGSITALSGSLAQLSTTGGGRAKKFFEALGIHATDSKGKVKPAVDVLLDLSSKFEKMTKQESFGLGQKLGLDQGTIMLLQKGRGEVEKLVGEMREMSYSKRDAEVAGEFDDNLQKLGKSLKLIVAQLFNYVGPAINFVLNAFKEGVLFLRNHEKFVLTFITLLAAFLATKLVPVITTQLIPAILKMGKAWLANPMTWVIAGLLLLAAVLEDLWVYIDGGDSALADFWKIFGTGEEIGKELAAIWDNLKTKGLALWNSVGPQTVKALGIFLTGVTIFKAVAGTIGLVSNALNVMRFALMANPLLLILGLVAMAAVAIYENWDGICDFFSGIFDDVSNTVSEWIDDIISIMPDWLKKILGIDGESIKVTAEIDTQFKNISTGIANFAAAGSLGKSAFEAVSPTIAGASNVDNSSQTTINGGVHVNTPATDATGIARDIPQAINKENQKLVRTGERAGRR